MKFFITLMLIAMVRSALAQSVQFGLLVCEQGPVIYRQTTARGVSFQIEPPSQSQCTPGKIVCNRDFGFFAGHRGLNMCSVTRDCASRQQVCLRRFSGSSNTIIGCCKPGFEAWTLSGSQKTSGNQNPGPQQVARFAAPNAYAERVPLPSTYAERVPLPSTYAERVPVPSTYAERVPLPSTYAERVPLPSTYAERVPLPSTYAERVPLPSTYAERVPLPSTYAERVPVPSTYAERVPAPSAAPVRIHAADSH